LLIAEKPGSGTVFQIDNTGGAITNYLGASVITPGNGIAANSYAYQQIQSTSASWEAFTRYTSGANNIFTGIASTTGNYYISQGTFNNVPLVSVTPAGNVGIGTTTPFGTLSVNAAAGATSFIIGSSTATNFIVAKNGNVGIGTTSPTALLHVSKSDATDLLPQLYLENTSGTVGGIKATAVSDAAGGYLSFGGNVASITSSVPVTINSQYSIRRPATFGYIAATTAANSRFYFQTAPNGTGQALTEVMSILNSGNVGIGTTTPWRNLAVMGTVGFDGLSTGAGAGALCLSANKEVLYSAGAGCTVSSGRFKHDITTATTGLDFVSKLRPVNFYYNADVGVPGEQFGFIAEEVETLDPRLVVHDAQGLPFSVRYENMTAVLALGIQELNLNMSAIASTTATSTPQSSSFANSFFTNLFSRVGAWLADAGNGIQSVFAKKVSTEELCVSDASGAKTCINKAQLDALIFSAANGGSGNASSTDTVAPVISILGDNPAVLPAGVTYADMGATVSDIGVGGVVNDNLGLHFSVDGIDMQAVQIDTTASSTLASPATTTHAVVYSAVDGAGNWAYATRTVDVVQ
jgi:hypothetical protein